MGLGAVERELARVERDHQASQQPWRPLLGRLSQPGSGIAHETGETPPASPAVVVRGMSCAPSAPDRWPLDVARSQTRQIDSPGLLATPAGLRAGEPRSGRSAPTDCSLGAGRMENAHPLEDLLENGGDAKGAPRAGAARVNPGLDGDERENAALGISRRALRRAAGEAPSASPEPWCRRRMRTCSCFARSQRAARLG